LVSGIQEFGSPTLAVRSLAMSPGHDAGIAPVPGAGRSRR
jgi:hypothetical protein